MKFLNVRTPDLSRLCAGLTSRRLTPLLAVASLMAFPMAASAQLPTPSHGWNMGNTMEAPCGVGCWSPLPTQALINSVAAQGFNTVRIPCAWMSHSSRTGVIDPTFISQVKQVVDWCYAKGLYVVVNDHWDNGWFDGSNFSRYDSKLNGKMATMWTQIANTFKTYDSHLLFACANEPPANTQAQTVVLYKYFQTFVNTVRGTGANNSTRWLIVQAPSANIDYAYNWVTSSVFPADPAAHTMIEAHYYDPAQFAFLSSDATWGAMFYFWGAPYHVAHGPTNRNATWGEESYMQAELDKMQSTFVSKGIPVLMGEWGAAAKPSEPDLTGAYITQNRNSATYWNYTFHNEANARGLYCTCWDTPGSNFDWTTGAVTNQTQVDSLLGKSYLPPVAGL